MCENPVFRVPLTCVIIGVTCCLFGFIFSIILATSHEVRRDGRFRSNIRVFVKTAGSLFIQMQQNKIIFHEMSLCTFM